LIEKVSRNVGLAVFALMDEIIMGLAPSRIAGLLRGIRSKESVVVHPEWLKLEQFGAEACRSHDEVLRDILALWARGYLGTRPGENNRLELTDLGRQALHDSARK
jgi:hypothetical protein